MKKVLFLMTFVISVLGISAQNTKIITGAVIDKNGNPLPNALIEATGGAESVTTDADGSFRIEVPIWLKSLTAKYAGLEDKKIKLKHNTQVIFEMQPKSGCWFLDVAFSANFGDSTFGRAGFMGGYLGKWGGYAKVMPSFGGHANGVPSATAGVIKQVAKPVYLYLGAGFAQVYGSYYDYYYTEGDDEDGGMFEAGAIFKFNKVNFSLGYAFSTSFCCYDNHSVQLSVGYCF